MNPWRERYLNHIVKHPADVFGPEDALQEILKLRESLRQRDEQIDILAHEVEDRVAAHARLVAAVKDALHQCYDTYHGHVVPDHVLDALREALKKDA